jgi:hypothetical protein
MIGRTLSHYKVLENPSSEDGGEAHSARKLSFYFVIKAYFGQAMSYIKFARWALTC